MQQTRIAKYEQICTGVIRRVKIVPVTCVTYRQRRGSGHLDCTPCRRRQTRGKTRLWRSICPRGSTDRSDSVRSQTSHLLMPASATVTVMTCLKAASALPFFAHLISDSFTQQLTNAVSTATCWLVFAKVIFNFDEIFGQTIKFWLGQTEILPKKGQKWHLL